MRENIVSYTSEELTAMRTQSESLTDWQRWQRVQVWITDHPKSLT